MNQDTVFIYQTENTSLRFAYDSPFWLTDLSGVSSVDISVSEVQSAGQTGSSITNQSVQPRSFTLNGCLFDPVEQNRRKLLDAIAPLALARLIKQDGNEAYYLEVVPTRTPEISAGIGTQEFQVQLLAAYPYWRTVAEHSVAVAGLTALFRFPFFTGGDWYMSQFSDTYYKVVENSGNVPMEFEVVFTARAAVVNPELYHVGTRERIRLLRTMEAGESIAVSTMYGQKRAVITHPDGSQSNGFRFLSYDSDLGMQLLPGENVLRSGADEYRENLSTHVQVAQGVMSGV